MSEIKMPEIVIAICQNCLYENWASCEVHPGKFNYVRGKVEYEGCWQHNKEGKCADYKPRPKRKWWQFWKE